MLCRNIGRFLRKGSSFLYKWKVGHPFLQAASIHSQFVLDETSIRKLVDQAAGNVNRGKNSHYSLSLQGILTAIAAKQSELKELEAMACDKELRDMADIDLVALQKSINELGEQLVEVLLKTESDPMDESDGLVLEVSAGVGGQEAMLFSEELFQMYKSFASFNGWDFETLSFAETELGGVRQASGSVKGPNAYKLLKYEAGVHRVQRTPKTEKAGRIHTSTSTIAILPTPSDILVDINPADLRIETKRASGAGGQHVNKTESAVRITHVPSGIVVDSQTQRSQIQNKSLGMTILRAKLYERQLEAQMNEIKSTRKLQVGTRLRSDKIRTYNFAQDRVTDHRIGLTVHNIQGILDGQENLANFLENLEEYDRKERLNSILSGK